MRSVNWKAPTGAPNFSSTGVSSSSLHDHVASLPNPDILTHARLPVTTALSVSLLKTSYFLTDTMDFHLTRRGYVVDCHPFVQLDATKSSLFSRITPLTFDSSGLETSRERGTPILRNHGRFYYPCLSRPLSSKSSVHYQHTHSMQ